MKNEEENQAETNLHRRKLDEGQCTQEGAKFWPRLAGVFRQADQGGSIQSPQSRRETAGVTDRIVKLRPDFFHGAATFWRVSPVESEQGLHRGLGHIDCVGLLRLSGLVSIMRRFLEVSSHCGIMGQKKAMVTQAVIAG